MPKIAFLFPGQGAQFVGMAKGLVESLPQARSLFDLAKSALGYDLLDICVNGPEAKLNTTEISQPAIFVSSLAALAQLQATEPDTVAACQAAAGLSLGEYTALCFAGTTAIADGLRLVQRRGQAMQAAADATPSGMVSVLGLENEKLEALCKEASAAGLIQMANFLAPNHTVVSGAKAALDAVEPLATTAGAMKTIRLPVAGAFHTSIMKPADQALAQTLAPMKLATARIPVWSNVDASPHTDPHELRSLLVRQVLEPVRWEETMRKLLAEGFDKFYEIGPGRVLAGLLKRVNRKTECVSVGA